MALIKCTNCGHMISDKAVRCPKCGNEIISQRANNDIKNIQVPKKTKKVIEVDEERLKKDNWGKTSIAVAIFLILIVVFVASQYGFGGFGIYGIVVLAIVSILLVCKGIVAINYLKTGNAKMLLYYLKTKGMTYLLFLLGITGVVGLGVDVYQSVEHDKLVEARNCEKYSFFKADAPLFVKWSYCKWDENDKLCAYSVVASYGAEKYKWDEDVNEVAFSAHLCSNNSHETQSLLRLSIVHNEDNEKRDLPLDAILLGFNKAHTEHFSIHHEYDDEIPVNIRIDDESTLKFKCHYTTNYDDWYALLIYGKQYETLLAKLKTGKACTITIDDVDKVYTFDIKDLNWGNKMDNEVKESIEEVNPNLNNVVPTVSELKSNPNDEIKENIQLIPAYDFPSTDENFKVEQQQKEGYWLLKIYEKGVLIQECESNISCDNIRFVDINFDGYTDIYLIGNKRSSILLWEALNNRFVSKDNEFYDMGISLQNPFLDVENKCVYEYNELHNEYYYTKYVFSENNFKEIGKLRYIPDLKEYNEHFSYLNVSEVFSYILIEEDRSETLNTNLKTELPPQWQNVLDKIR